jgi:hypothetical protein
MWITTEIGALRIDKVRVVAVFRNKIRIFCLDPNGDTDIPYGTHKKANQAYDRIKFQILQTSSSGTLAGKP